MNRDRVSAGRSPGPAGERRWQERRQAAEPVRSDRREGSDRRERSGRLRTRGLEWLDRVSQTLRMPRQSHPDGEPRPSDRARPGSSGETLVTARHGIVGTVYAAWERVDGPEADGGRYRTFHGTLFRQIGSGALQAQSLAAVDDLVGAYEDVYARAYELIFARHPELRGHGEPRDGTVVLLDDTVS